MAEEAIQAVRQAETAAAALIKEAGVKRDAMLLEAKQKAEHDRNETVQRAALNETDALTKVNADGEIKLNEAVKEAEAEIAGLKKLAAARQKEAIELVVGALV